jgi:DNA-binding CsgD family transcriptional regulator
MHVDELVFLDSGTIDSLLAGESSLVLLDSVTIDDVTDNVRLKNTYYNSGASNLSDFLKLGEKRLEMRNCGRKTELILRECVERFLSSAPQLHLDAKCLNHGQLLRELELSRRIRKSEWNIIRKDLRKSKYSEYQISSVAAELDLDWPISPRSAMSSMKIGDFLEMTLAEIREVKGFGRKKLLVYLRCAVYLHQRLQDGDVIEEYLGIPDRVRLILKHGRLTQREEEIIRFRFGIQKERKHTLSEIKDFYEITRERVRQIESKALKKLRMSRYFSSLPKLLIENKEYIWEQICDKGRLRKLDWMEPLEDSLGYEYQIALEICDDTAHRNPNTSVLANWLDTHFYHDETYWYKVEPSPLGELKNRDRVSTELLEFIDQL